MYVVLNSNTVIKLPDGILRTDLATGEPYYYNKRLTASYELRRYTIVSSRQRKPEF